MSRKLQVLKKNWYTRCMEYADEIVEQSMVPLCDKNIKLIYRETYARSLTELRLISKFIIQKCGRVMILTSQDEATHLVIAKSKNVEHLYVDEIIDEIIKRHGGEKAGDEYFATATFNQLDIIPQIIDQAVEAIVVAMPYTTS